MKKIEMYSFLLVLISTILTTSLSAQKQMMNLKVDKSQMEWLGKKVTGEHSGTIQFKEGFIKIENGEIKDGGIVVDMNSIVCTDIKNEEYRKKLDGHLKSDDFFGVKKYPKAKFELQESRSLSDGNVEVKGNIQIKGIVQPITFTMKKEMMENTVHLKGTMLIDRTKFKIRYGSGSFFDNLGDRTIYDEFELKFHMIFE